jgi:hypothetical protein
VGPVRMRGNLPLILLHAKHYCTPPFPELLLRNFSANIHFGNPMTNSGFCLRYRLLNINSCSNFYYTVR